jgi:hypothetical protein
MHASASSLPLTCVAAKPRPCLEEAAPGTRTQRAPVAGVASRHIAVVTTAQLSALINWSACSVRSVPSVLINYPLAGVNQARRPIATAVLNKTHARLVQYVRSIITFLIMKERKISTTCATAKSEINDASFLAGLNSINCLRPQSYSHTTVTKLLPLFIFLFIFDINLI